ncbi:sigma-54 interaction domain-containing protein [Planctomicrobium piriforme]|uniref:Two-component system, NtrC family, response regulator HydG/two-component system, NtrC family, response regulator AtoC n=1 Tax=Planctomicrobium piriforme TaxID=1576369 RepID=A0A1I3HMZ0_9PLAN|nr:sigma-54 dependent transcriptional regulator [Planctomicrobium piriforme]SFI37061.1 two-component system, NtrC family, response regulator HydG/two-component system, NtrC family, response regulator AtoC [Planctomicrobium piriforme]
MSVIFQSRAMLQVIERAKRYARTSVTVLLCGESGTGKELLARLIHQYSPRQHSEYVRVNCAALSESLIESELFGHEAGAFTGAHQLRRGRFEAAGEGTVFLDEIGELPLAVQAKLLRVLEEKEFQRVGGNETLRMHARVITATNRDLAVEARRGHFRADLFHRLNVLPLAIPPLRERREDIPALVNFFVQQAQVELERPVRGVTRPVMERLSEYDWPGNVRELKNVILRCCLLAASDTIQTVELPSPVIEDEAEVSATLPQFLDHLSLEEIERQVILHRLERCQGNKTEAAAALGVTPRTLRNKVTHYRKLGYVS